MVPLLVSSLEHIGIFVFLGLGVIECGKLERIGERALSGCKSLSSVDLPSIKIVGQHQFAGCVNLTSVSFGKDLESIKYKALWVFTE